MCLFGFRAHIIFLPPHLSPPEERRKRATLKIFQIYHLRIVCRHTHVHTRRCMLAYVSPSSKWTLSRSMVAYKPHCFVHQVLLAPEPHTDFFFPFLAAFVAHRVPRPGIRSEPQLQSMLQQYRILYSGGPGIERVSWCSRDTTDPVATQWEHHT